jgi:hypothetical protein
VSMATSMIAERPLPRVRSRLRVVRRNIRLQRRICPMSIRPVFPILMSVSLLACDDHTAPNTRLAVWIPDSASTIVHESYSGMSEPIRLVVTDTATWRRTWQQIYGIHGSPPTLPDVNFGGSSVLVAAFGVQPSGGFDIWIDSLVRFETSAVVYLTEKSPGPGCGVTLVWTQPVHAVLTTAPVYVDEWRTQQITSACP